MPAYRFQLLRYAPTLSGEFYNVAVVLYDATGRIVDARFASAFDRMRCNPAVELRVLEALRNEFEEQRLLGEGFHAYLNVLSKNLSDSLEITDQKPFEGGDAAGELDRLVATYLATPSGLTTANGQSAATGRRAVRLLMANTFERHGILSPDLVREGIDVPYAGTRLVFRFDFGYEPRGEQKLLHALGGRGAVQEATRLGFVMDRLRDREPKRSLTAVYEEGLVDEALELLELSAIPSVPVSELEPLATRIRDELSA
ncbi:MAG: DUF3037 domain-containing protein [Acidobacteria bacterium]|nr:DUF3037 domain-containing protein [Acidobacteriota bacterium]MDA1233299.1 DUF3037 domain-containing protein [Acidobacteriota bacterium]